MSAGDVLYAISKAGLTVKMGETGDTLKVYPAENITPELAAGIREHKADIIHILREDEAEKYRNGAPKERSSNGSQADTSTSSQSTNHRH